MTGSTAPQRALARLDRLVLPVESIEEAAALAALLGDPLATLATEPFNDSVLRDVLDRLASTTPDRSVTPLRQRRARASGSRSRRRSPLPAATGPLADGETSGAGGRSANGGRTRLPQASSANPSTAAPGVPDGPLGTAPRSGRIRSGPGNALARIARRVPGGLAAIAAPVAPPSPSSDTDPGAGAAGNGMVEAILRRRSPRPEPFSGSTAEPGEQAHLDRAPGGLPRPGTAPAAQAEPEASAESPAGQAPAGPGAAGTGRSPELTGAVPLLTSRSAHGLAELVRRWEQGGGSEYEGGNVPARSHEPAREHGSPEEEQALAKAVERLFVGELRRHGIEVEVG